MKNGPGDARRQHGNKSHRETHADGFILVGTHPDKGAERQKAHKHDVVNQKSFNKDTEQVHEAAP
jgi:hypothetical protein